MEEDPTRRNTQNQPAEVSAPEGWTNTTVAGKALGVSPRTVLSYIRRGLLEGRAEGEGVKRTWYVSIGSLNALRAQRFAQGSAEVFRESSAEQVAESVAEALTKISERLAEEAARAAEFRTRLELTEQAQSSVEEEARNLREENERLRAQLVVGTERRSSSKGFWRRIFRGRRGRPPAWR